MLTEREQIDRIVREVLSRLSTSAIAVRETNGHTPTTKHRVVFTESVITGEMLSQQRVVDQTVDIGVNTILTPTARDWIRSQNVTVHRVAKAEKANSGNTNQTATVCVVNPTAALEQLLADTGLAHEAFDCPDEAAEFAAEDVTSGRVTKAVVFAAWCHRAAMLANRHAKVRASVIVDVSDVRRINKQMKPNVWCLDPKDRGYMELRNLHRQIAAT